MDTIPLVDFERISTENGRIPSDLDWEVVSSEVDRALSQIGFVYLKNHGIPQDKIDACFEESNTFFHLPNDVKVKYTKDIKLSYSGYTQPNQEQLDPSSSYEFRESFDISGVMHADVKLRTPDKEVPNFRAKLIGLKAECTQLLDKLHRILAKGLQLEDEEFFIKHNRFLADPSVSTCSTFRTLFYPAVPESMKIEEGTVRCAAHSDYGTLTLLFQDQIGGLEVKTAQNVWVPATPIPGTILVNTGDLLQFWSGGKYPATIHRVLIPESEIKKRVFRQSIAYFVHPDDNVLVSPLTPCQGQEDSASPVSALEHCMSRLAKSYNY